MDGTLQDVGAAAAFDASHVLVSFSNATAPGSDRFIGPVGVRQFIAGLHADCLSDLSGTQSATSVVPILYVTIDDLIVESRGEPACPKEFLAACRWTLRGTRPDPSPRSVKIQGTWVSRVKGDQMVESWVWDTRNLNPLARETVPPDPGRGQFRQPPKKVVHRWLWLGWRKGNLSLVDECFASSYIHNDCGYFPAICGRSEYKKWLKEKSLNDSAPRDDREIVHLFGEGDRVVAVLRWADDELGVVVYRVAGGEIQESWWTWDTQRLCLGEREHRVAGAATAHWPIIANL